jgi:hypothetical protein
METVNFRLIRQTKKCFNSALLSTGTRNLYRITTGFNQPKNWSKATDRPQ